VTNNDTIAYFGPVTVSVVVSKVPIAINSNMPPVIITLTNGVTLDPTNYGGSDFYQISVPTNAYGALFEIDNPTGPMALVVKHDLPLPSLSDYDYYTNGPPAPANEQIAVLTNSMPVPLTSGEWYMAAVNVAGSNVIYDVKITLLQNILPPVFISPTNTDVFTNIETTLFTNQCVATDPNSPPLPLSFGLVSGPTNMTVSSAGAITWTPTEAQGPSTNSIKVNVSNGAFSVTNTFTVIVEESNLPPVPPIVPDQVVVVSNLLTVTNIATDPDIPTNELTYTLSSTVPGTNLPIIDTNGIITWTPTIDVAGSRYLFTAVVTDTNQWAVNSKSLSATNSFYVTVAFNENPGTPQTNVVHPGGIHWVAVNVPTNAIAATNTLIYATNLPVNLWFSTNVPPTVTNTTDVELLPNVTNGVVVLTPDSLPAHFVPGRTYYLGVQNPNSFDVAYALRVDFLLRIPLASIVYTNLDGTNGFLLTWFAPSNYLFQVQWTASLAPINWHTFTNIISYNPTAFTSPTNTQFNFFDNGSQTGGFGPTRFYRLLLLTTGPLTVPPSQTNFITHLAAPVVVTATNAAFSWTAPTNEQFKVRWATNLTPPINWLPFPGVVTSSNGVFTFVDSNAPPLMKFYELILQP
jgi:hypothetical protein